MKICTAEQGTKEWIADRCGIPSASNFDMIITADGKPSKQRTKYLYRLAGERVSGIVEETYQNAAMLRGKELEDEARQLYQITTGKEVKQVGFCVTEKNPIYGASPDGLVENDGLVEIKCPQVATHVGYLIANVLPVDYFQQTQGQLLVTGRKWNDFVSYSPGLKPLIIRVYPDKKFLKALAVELELFTSELDEITKKIK